MYVNGVINISMNRSDQSMENIANHPQIEGSSVIAMRGNAGLYFFVLKKLEGKQERNRSQKGTKKH